MFKKLLFLTTFILVLGLVPASPVRAELIGWWTFDEGSGNTAFDMSGFGNDGTLNGDPVWVEGYFGGGLELSSDYVAIDGIADDLTENNFTVMAWIKTTMSGDGNVIGANTTGSSHDFIFGVDGGNLLVEADSINTYPPTITDGEWHHIAYTRDGTSAFAYTDGELVGTETPSGDPSGQARWSIGMEWDSSPSDFFNGTVDDVRFYNHPLTQEEVLGAMVGTGFPLAGRPEPADGAILLDTWANLNWRAGDFAVTHDVYLGENFDDVSNGTGDTFVGNQSAIGLIVGFVGFPIPDGLVPGTTYYWRVDEVNDADPNSPWTGDVWSFSVPPLTAHNPVPADGIEYVATDVELNWTAGFRAKMHTVYFGDNLDDVSNASGGAPQLFAKYSPGALETDKTYYWRVDEFDPPVTNKGEVWSFSTLPVIPVTDPDLVGWWTLDEGAVAFDSSGHGNHGTIEGAAQWEPGYDNEALVFDGRNNFIDIATGIAGSGVGSVTAWIRTKQSSRGMILYGSDGTSGNGYGDENELHLNVEDGGVIEFWIDGPVDTGVETWPVNSNAWHHVAATWDSTAGVNLYLDGELAASAGHNNNNFDFSGRLRIGRPNASERYYSGALDDLRLYSKALTQDEVQLVMRGDPDLAWNASPGGGSKVGIGQATPLSWSAGNGATQHDVYFGTDGDAVNSADASDATGVYRGRQSATTHTPSEGVEWGGGPYYWRVDEVTADGTISKGRVLSFTVADFLLVDDFESYNDLDPPNPISNRIFDKWIDGFGTTTNGALVGNDMPPYAERSVVHGGGQSMIYAYDNAGKTSEATLTLVSPRDWTAQGVTKLSLWFRGSSANAGERMFVALNGTSVVYNDDSAATQATGWNEWVVDLAAFGVDLTNINTITIGFGTKNSPAAGGGTGTMYFDDIRLIR